MKNILTITRNLNIIKLQNDSYQLNIMHYISKKEEKMDYALGIDVGTTSVKVIMISKDGKIFDESSAAHDLISLHPNWAEEDAGIWWDNVKAAVQSIQKRHPEEMENVKVIDPVLPFHQW